MRPRFAPVVLALAFATASALASSAEAQSSENVLLVINELSPDSIRIGEHYAAVRAVPATQVVRIKAPVSEAISRADFDAAIEGPIGAWLSSHLLQDRVLFIVLAKGIPLRVDGTGGLPGTMASVDSELTLLYRKLTGAPVLAAGRIDNPYFLREQPLSEARRFSRIDADIYLVTRLDGFTADDVIKLIDRGVNPSRDGRIVLDQKSTMLDRGGDMWLAEAASRLTVAGQGSRVQLETTRALATSTEPVLGYFSWGSNDPANQLRQVGLRFSAGSIGGMYVSTDGRTFKEPGSAWKPAPAGSATGGQSLVGDLIREGITGISASVAEPYLDGIVRPQILFPAYLSGFTLAESYYLAMPYLSWETIVIGDPLCAPFLSAPLTQDRLHKGIDDGTSLPALFAERRLAAIRTGDLKPDAIKLQLKAVSLQAQGKPKAEVRNALERAIAIEPRLNSAQWMLAEIAEAVGEQDTAIARYRAILQTDPNHLAALNNLAYALADKKNQAEEALPLAERAYRLSKQAPVVADTLGWVHFKLNQLAAALPLIERAAASLPGSVDILVHAAAINVAANNRERAKGYLEAAVKADPTASAREDVKALMAKIKG
jgi:uncharacterized protein (TIGR03790 family)